MKSLVIIPTYNEKENIHLIIKEVRKYIKTDVLVMDDSSPDGTADIVKEMKRNAKWLYLKVRPKKMGLASAYLTGFNYAIKHNYDVVFEMDADFSHSPKYLPHFLEQIKEHDVVIGSRYVKGGGVSNWKKSRLFISKGGNFYAKLILGVPVKDITGGFKCFKVSALKKIDLKKITSEGYSFQVEVNYIFHKNGFKIKEIPIVFEERREGKSKMSKKIFIEALFKVWKFRFMSTKKFIKKD